MLDMTNTQIVKQQIEHTQLVKNLLKPSAAIIDDMTPTKANLVHLALGIGGEAGEIIDCVKKCVIYNKPLDRENLIEELGDLEFYMEAIRQQIGVSREETIEHNLTKLRKRYSKLTYSDEDAQIRADKN